MQDGKVSSSASRKLLAPSIGLNGHEASDARRNDKVAVNPLRVSAPLSLSYHIARLREKNSVSDRTAYPRVLRLEYVLNGSSEPFKSERTVVLFGG